MNCFMIIFPYAYPWVLKYDNLELGIAYSIAKYLYIGALYKILFQK
jgi:hypothetical protein